MKNINNNNTKKHNFVTINRQIYLFESLDEVNRVFVGHKITKEIVDDMINGVNDESVINKTTILFREQGENDVYIRDTILSSFADLYYIHTLYRSSFRYPSEERYNNAKQQLKKHELQLLGNWFQRFFASKKNIEVINETIEEYESDEKRNQEMDAKYNKAKALKEDWVSLVKAKWF